MSVLATSMLVAGTWKKVVELIEVSGKNGEENQGEYPQDLA